MRKGYPGMPEWLIDTITSVMIVAFFAALWTAVQSGKNWRAVPPERERLKRIALVMFLKQIALMLAQGSLATMGILGSIVPRPGWARPATLILLVTTALALVGVSFHSYMVMRALLDGVTEDE